MKKNKASSRYARALFEIAQSQKKIDLVFKDTQLLISLLDSNTELSDLVQNPTISPKYKQDLLTRVFGNYLDGITIRFFEMIVKKGRDPLLSQILNRYQELYFELKNEVLVTVTSARRLSDAQISLIKDRVKPGSGVRIKEQIDPAMLGGVIIDTNGKQYSTCVKTKLEMIKKTFQL